MTKSPEAALIESALRSASDTRVLEIGHGILDQTHQHFRKEFENREAVIVADTATFQIAGKLVADAFARSKHPSREPFIYDAFSVYADHANMEMLEASLKQHSAIPVVVGAGTLNDLTKLAAYRAGRSYVCIPTAASMDGYTSFGASITFQGSKQTFHCPAPRIVLADLDLICAAPGKMNAWGYADLLAKVTAGADWMLADALGEEPLHPVAWHIAQSRLRELITNPAGVRDRDPATIAKLVEGLMLGGFAMQAASTSRAASGAEHQFSHLWDMEHHTHNGAAPSHGFKVAIGTIASTALYEFMLEQPVDKLDIKAIPTLWREEAWRDKTIQQLFGAGKLAQIATRETAAKTPTLEALNNQLIHLRDAWPDLRSKLQRQLLPMLKLKSLLRDAGAPVDSAEIGITTQRLRRSYLAAWFIRRRFTILDLAVRTGLLDSALNHIFGTVLQ